MEIRPIIKFFEQVNDFTGHQPFLVGISGGPDSLALLHLLKSNHVPVAAAHLDHSLRPTSVLEAGFVRHFCASFGIPLTIKKVDVSAEAVQRKWSLEETARYLRYKFLFEVAETGDFQAVVTAHNANDQVETILMHMIRGSGVSGLTGIRAILIPNPWSDHIPLMRPFLQTWRDDIQRYCDDNDLHPVKDESNMDTRYHRNRIRHELVPLLNTYNPSFQASLLRTTNVISVEDDWANQLTNHKWGEIAIGQSASHVALGLSELKATHLALTRRLIRKSILSLKTDLRDIDYATVERAVEFLNNSNRSNRVELCAGLEMFRFLREQVILAYTGRRLDELWPQFVTTGEVKISVPGEYTLNDTWKFSIHNQSQAGLDDNPYHCHLDASKLKEGLTLRQFHPGDVFSPYGMGGKTLKLGDFWTNVRLPARARKLWPLVCCAGQIVWVPGFRVAENAKVTVETKEVISIELNKRSGD